MEKLKALARLRRCYRQAGATAPQGWPRKETEILREIGRFWEVPAPPPPGVLRGLEEKVMSLLESLLEAAGALSSRRDARELARAGYRHVTSGDLKKMGIGAGRIEDQVKRGLRKGKFVDWAPDTDGKYWVLDEKTGD
jgi:hypothetical protein